MKFREGICVALAAVIVAAASEDHVKTTARRCTMAPGAAQLLVYVERDTLLTMAPVDREVLASSSVQRSDFDSLLATSSTLMTAARVRLLDLDESTRSALTAAGITEASPLSYIMAAPYRADCRTMKYTDTSAWTMPGDTGFARASLATRDAWINGVPLFVIAETWSYPFPRQGRRLPFVDPLAPAASARAYFSFSNSVLSSASKQVAPASVAFDLSTTVLNSTPPVFFQDIVNASQAERAIQWARAHPADAEREPIRRMIRTGILRLDMATVRTAPSRIRGTYRVTMQARDTTVSWEFRTVATAGYSWQARDSMRSTADIVASPYVSGTQLVGYGADSAGKLLSSTPQGSAIRAVPLVWLSASDHPTRPVATAERDVSADLMFKQFAAPPAIWSALDAFVDAPSASTRQAIERLATMNKRDPRAEEQPHIPMTLHFRSDGSVRADTIIVREGRPLRVTLTRIDSLHYSNR